MKIIEELSNQKFDLVGRSVKMMKLHANVQGYREKRRLFLCVSLYIYVKRGKY